MKTEHMRIMVGDLAFLAVPLAHATFNEKGAIHAIFDIAPDGSFTLLDIGESSDTGAPAMNAPERQACWRRHSKQQNLWVGSYFEPAEKLFGAAKNPKEDRTRVAEALRAHYHVPCGEVWSTPQETNSAASKS